jgi:hypothetical protein
MQQKDKSKLESRDLLENRVYTPVQAFSTDVKYPCTGFCYSVAQHKDTIIELYQKRSLDGNCPEYKEFILDLIVAAGERKRNNQKIHDRGEYINQESVRDDFPDIYNQLVFKEVGTPTEESFAIAQNELYMMLMDVVIGGYMFVTRSHETFIMIKIDFDQFLVVDSHQAFHGTLSLEKGTHYILKNGTYKGLTQVGYTSSGLI